MDAQADLHLCCSHMVKTGFLMTWLICLLTAVEDKGPGFVMMMGAKDLVKEHWFQ